VGRPDAQTGLPVSDQGQVTQLWCQMIWLVAATKRFWLGVEGASIVEYALLLLLISVVTIVVLANFGSALSSLFNSAASSI
jgi:Flp pilus assembly pilin Flp